MDGLRDRGRWIGAAMLAGAAIEAGSDFGLQGRLFAGGGFVVNAGAQPWTVGSVIVLGLLAGLLSLWVATLISVPELDAFPVLSRAYLLLTAVALAGTLAELSTFVAMRGLSEAFAAAGPESGDRFEAARVVVRGIRNGLHFSVKTLQGSSLLVFYTLLWNARSVPRLLAGIGLPAALLQMVGVGAPLFGGDVLYPLLAPIAIVYLATGAWLLVKGLPAKRDVAGRSQLGAFAR